MRKKGYLEMPKFTIKEYSVKDFNKLTDFSLHVDLGENVLMNRFSLSYLCSYVGTLAKSYFIDNRFFFYTKNNRILECVNYRVENFLLNVTEPLMIDVVIDGKKEILVIEKNSCYIAKKDITFNFPYGTSIAKYDGRIFVANGKNIYYSNEFNFTQYSTNIENAGFLSVDNDAESILELISFRDCLYAVCNKSIYKLTITNGEFNFNKCEINQLNILVGSVKKVGKKIYFISNYRLCVFDGNSFKVIEGEFDRFLEGVKENATTTEGLYIIKTVVDSSPTYFVYNTNTGKHHFLYIDTEGIIAENGFVYIAKNGVFYNVKYNKNMQRCCWYSKAMDFSTNKKKVLIELRINVATELELTVEGDFGVKKIKLKEGLNIKKLNLASRLFKFSINIRAYNFFIKDFNCVYSIWGV